MITLAADKTETIKVGYVAEGRSSFIIAESAEAASKGNAIIFPQQQAFSKGIVDVTTLMNKTLVVTPRTQSTGKQAAWLGNVVLAMDTNFRTKLEDAAAKFRAAQVFVSTIQDAA